MAIGIGSKARARFGALIVGNPVGDGGSNPNAGLLIASSATNAVVSISAASAAVVTTTSAHNLNIGQIVTIAGVTGSGAVKCNGTYVITAVGSTTTFTLGGVVTTGLTNTITNATITLVQPPVNAAQGSQAGGVAATNVTNSSTTVTVTAPGNWIPGQQVVLTGISGFTTHNPNGTWTIVTGGNGTFTVTVTSAPTGTGSAFGKVISYPLTGVNPAGASPTVLKGFYLFSDITLTPSASILTTASAEITVLLPGVNLGDIIVPAPTSALLASGGAGIGINVSVAVVAANTVVVTLTNTTGSTITAANASILMNFLWIRLV
jgi:hypothetical protein